MGIYAVGTKRNPANKKAITHFVIYNTDTNGLETLSHKDVRTILQDAEHPMANVELGEDNKVIGICFDAHDMPYCLLGDSDWVINPNKHCMAICYDNNGDMLIVELKDESTADLGVYSKIESDVLKKAGMLVNENNGVLVGCNAVDDCHALGDYHGIEILDEYLDEHQDELRSRENILRSIDTSIGIMTNQQESRKDVLLKEAYDKDIVWDIETFEEFMHLMDWDYMLSKNPQLEVCINQISNQCTVLHIPKGIYSSNLLFDGRPNNIDTIIFGPDYREIRRMYMTNKSDQYEIVDILSSEWNNNGGRGLEKMMADSQPLIDINNIYFQEGKVERKGKFKGLCGLHVHGVAEIPKINYIEDLYKACVIDDLNYGDVDIEKYIDKSEHRDLHGELRNCMELVELGNPHIRINCAYAQNSFNFCSGPDNFEVTVGKDFNELTIWAISNCNVTKIHFEEGCALNRIYNALRKCPNLIECDISHLTELTSLNNCLSDCPNLEWPKLPESIDTIGTFVGDGCRSLTRVELSELMCLKGVISFPTLNGATLVFTSPGTQFTSALFRTYDGVNPLEFVSPILSCMTTLGGLKGTTLEDTHLPTTIKEIPEKFLQSAKLKNFDSAYFPDLHYFPNSMFTGSPIIESVIINSNIEKIGDDLFKDCTALETVVISDSVKEMSSKAFRTLAAQSPVSVYVVQGSVAHKKLKSLTKISLLAASSLDEAIDMAFNRGKTADSKKGRYNFLLEGTKYSPLVNPDVVDYVQKTYEICTYVDENDPSLEPRPELDTRKFSTGGADVPDGFFESSLRLDSEFIEQCCTPELNDARERNFIGMCNLVTALFDNDPHCYTDAFMEVFKGTTLKLMCLIGEPAYHIGGYIACVSLTGYLEEVRLLVIALHGKFVFVTPFSHNIYIVNSETGQLEWPSMVLSVVDAVSKIGESRKPAVSVCKFLGCGDSITNINYNKSRIGGATFPGVEYPGTGDLPYKSFKATVIALGGTGLSKKIASRARSNKSHDILFYCPLTQSLILGLCAIGEFGTDRGIVNSITVREIKPLSELESFETIVHSIRESSRSANSSRVALYSMGPSEITDAYNDISRFGNLNGDTKLCYVADLIFGNSITDVKGLTEKPDLVPRVLDTSLFGDASVSLREVKDKPNIYTSEFACTIMNGTRAFLGFEKKQNKEMNIPMHLVGMPSMTSSLSSKKAFKYSTVKLNDIIGALYALGETRQTHSREPICRISDNPINTEDFYFLNTIVPDENAYNTHGTKIYLAMDKANGDIYMLTDIWDMDYYSLFRFKNYLGAVAFCLNLQDSSSLLHDLMNMIRMITHKSVGRSDSSMLYKMRTYILGGIPDGHPYVGPCQGIMEAMAKQPQDSLWEEYKGIKV